MYESLELNEYLVKRQYCEGGGSSYDLRVNPESEGVNPDGAAVGEEGGLVLKEVTDSRRRWPSYIKQVTDSIPCGGGRVYDLSSKGSVEHMYGRRCGMAILRCFILLDVSFWVSSYLTSR